jgi:hypothetical protein
VRLGGNSWYVLLANATIRQGIACSPYIVSIIYKVTGYLQDSCGIPDMDEYFYQS